MKYRAREDAMTHPEPTKVTIPCPSCGAKHRVPLPALKARPKLRCRRCLTAFKGYVPPAELREPRRPISEEQILEWLQPPREDAE
jgi:uncharacterized paraquat-inducible protein A